MNKVILMGNLTRDVELRTTQSGKSVGSFGLATNESYIDKDGNKQNKAEFHNLVVWEKKADALAQYTKKGSKLLVEGKLSYSSYQNKDDMKVYKTEIIVNNFEFLDSKPSETFVKKESGSIGTEQVMETFDGKVVEDDINVDNIPF